MLHHTAPIYDDSTYWDLGQPLTAREKQIALIVARGLSNKEIGVELGLSRQTIKNHITQILAKTGSQDRTQIAVWVYDQQWILPKPCQPVDECPLKCGPPVSRRTLRPGAASKSTSPKPCHASSDRPSVSAPKRKRK